jgi:hypothetical protein
MAGKRLLPLLGHSSRHTPFSSSSAEHDPRDFAPPCPRADMTPIAHMEDLQRGIYRPNSSWKTFPTSTRGQIVAVSSFCPGRARVRFAYL